MEAKAMYPLQGTICPSLDPDALPTQASPSPGSEIHQCFSYMRMKQTPTLPLTILDLGN